MGMWIGRGWGGDVFKGHLGDVGYSWIAGQPDVEMARIENWMNWISDGGWIGIISWGGCCC